jgi:type IV pilus assembly protein PilV
MNVPRRWQGFGLIEILVTLSIIAVGMLGIAALHARVQQSQLEAYQRSQALILLQDIVSRLNANRTAARCYAMTDTDNGGLIFGTGSDPAKLVCSGYGTAATRAIADSDMAAWDAALKGSAEALDGNDVGGMIGARGCITSNGADSFFIAIAWQGLNETAAPADACAQNLYGSESLRRVLSTTVRIADLTN